MKIIKLKEMFSIERMTEIQEEIQNMLVESSENEYEIDSSSVTHIDVAGLQFLIGLKKEFEERKIKFSYKPDLNKTIVDFCDRMGADTNELLR